MANKYVMLTRTRENEVIEYVIVDDEVYPDDVKRFKANLPDWQRRQLLEDMLLVRFVVSPYQPQKEAKRKADEYLKFMNNQWDQMQVAAKLVQL